MWIAYVCWALGILEIVGAYVYSDRAAKYKGIFDEEANKAFRCLLTCAVWCLLGVSWVYLHHNTW